MKWLKILFKTSRYVPLNSFSYTCISCCWYQVVLCSQSILNGLYSRISQNFLIFKVMQFMTGQQGNFCSWFVATIVLYYLDPYSLTNLKNVPSLVLQIFLYVEAFERNTLFDWLHHTVQLIRSCVTFKLIKPSRKRQSPQQCS